MSRDPLWFKDAIIYELHVRSFFDSTGSGIGDFAGLTTKLPYLQDLGVTCLWLLPFYPSPLRDDGYDIADYRAVNPIYGSLDDFKRFVEEAHARDLRVLTELVVNHTSDQHPWFQQARRAPKGSPERDYYVWSDTDDKYAGTRIIFLDTEKSNWTFDQVAGQYYWHRFFSHQPDLNLDNPPVLEAIIDVMKFWFGMGVDALRLDAIPYLIEREGTINENLPETHAVLKRIRRELDAQFPDRALLAEANQWPADVSEYFGQGDECHMAYNFPLMPRMFMALRQEERHPIVEIVSQTPDIPDTCQWAIFLRNHDELTLEMVTDEERDYMNAQYAADPQMRLNLGIRRRLAPLMEFSRPRVELMNSLLFSMPGTPTIYYGDEIAMSDNVFLGDRNGVRTPMQWNNDRNGGFSRCDPSRLFLPANQDTIGGYEAVNVEADERSPFSLLNWMKRMIALRRRHTVFGRGSIEFIASSNRKVLAYLRRDERDAVLCIANLARTVQPLELDLSRFAGLTPVEMLGQTRFPAIGGLPYFLTLAPYGFYWFQLQEIADPAAPVARPEDVSSVPAILVGVVWDSLLDTATRDIIEREALPEFLRRQRWFGGKAQPLAGARFVDWALLHGGTQPAFITIVEAAYEDGGTEQYIVPLAILGTQAGAVVERNHPDAVLATIAGARKGLLCDGLVDDETCTALAASMLDGRVLNTRAALLRSAKLGLPAGADDPVAGPITRPVLEQSNTSVRFGTHAIMKLFRRLTPGPNPDIEIGQFLSRRGFTRVPRMIGALEYAGGAEQPASVAVLQGYVPHQGTGWEFTLNDLGRYFERVPSLRMPRPSRKEDAQRWIRGTRRTPPSSIAEALGTWVPMAEMLGRRTGELHGQLGSSTSDEPAFVPEAFDAVAARDTAAAMQLHAGERLALLEHILGHLDARRYEMAQLVLSQRETLLQPFAVLAELTDGGRRIRCHGDYHLGQVLVSESDIVILDFEGEPARPLAERRAKASPIRDVAGMLRSFSYAAASALAAAPANRPEDRERLTPWARLWERWASAVFLRAYLQVTRGDASMPPTPEALGALLDAYTLDKTLYELGYELNNRPERVYVPLEGLLRRLGRA